MIAYVVQLILNIAWNPVFFYFQETTSGLAVITALTLLIAYFTFNYWSNLRLYSLLILPYLVWLVIATSLNAYIVIMN